MFYMIYASSRYLRQIDKARAEGRRIVYLDETWLDYNHKYRAKREWLDKDGKLVNIK